MDVRSFERVVSDAIAQLDPMIRLQVLRPASYPGSFWLRLQDNEVQLAWLTAGWPRQVRDVLARPDRPDVVAANELSPGARQIVEDAGLSWFDGTGACRLSLPGLIVKVSFPDVVRPPRADLGWTPATLAVCEALLLGTPATVAETSRATTMAASTVATSLKFLQAENHLAAQADRGPRSRRTILDRGDLLEAYAAAALRMRTPVSIRLGVLWRDPARDCARLGKTLDAQGIAWSATSALAADVIAPYLTNIAPLEIYVQARDRAGLRGVGRHAELEESAGGRLLLRPFPTPAGRALSTIHRGVTVAAWPRVFADLRASGVRGEDAAEHLLEEEGWTRSD